MSEVLVLFEEHKLEFKSSFKEEVQYFKDKKTDIFFVTFNKSEKYYLKSSMYDNYDLDD